MLPLQKSLRYVEFVVDDIALQKTDVIDGILDGRKCALGSFKGSCISKAH